METLPIVGSIGGLFLTTVSGFLWLGLKLGRLAEKVEHGGEERKTNREKINGHIHDHATGDV
jgi:hypothetical protein|tara:strand:+ start:249 stop:434 length:186 start_codon:yes stop_codon:yes gene_type:complete